MEFHSDPGTLPAVQSWLRLIESSPLAVRVAPFALVALLTVGQGRFGVGSLFWLYLVKMVACGWLIWRLRKALPELQWQWSWEAGLTGVVVFGVWVGLDPYYPKWTIPGPEWNPFAYYGDHCLWAWLIVTMRWLGSSVIVPPLEEIFYRSFLYRWIARPDFMSLPLGVLNWRAMVLTPVIFGLAHREWLAGIFCGIAYQALVCHKKRLGDAVTAHAITNGLLGLWVVWKGAWHHW